MPISPSHTEPNVISTKLLSLVAEMAEELHPGQELSRIVSLDKSFERDLGFDSLSRLEVLHRVEREFSINLSEQALIQCDTPNDVLDEITGNSPTAVTNSTGPKDNIILNEQVSAAPEELTNLNAILRWHAAAHPDRIHAHFYADEDKEADTITYGELLLESEKIAAGLIERHLSPGESVLLMLPTGRDYFFGFFGVLLAGGVPVPIYPPGRPQQLEEHILRHAKIADKALAGLMITVAEAKLFSHLLSAQVPSLRHIVTCEELSSASPLSRFPEPTGDDLAFLQFTSGSTGDPKGVMLSHGNLVNNVQVMGKALKASSQDVFVSWLPLYHDMGLIGAWLGSLAHAVPLVIMSPLSFLARPQRWLQAIHRYGGTISGAPNFAYEACVNRIQDEDIAGLDLSTWRVAFNGAEAVSPKTIAQFSDRFAKYGFKPEAMKPVYGLAENCVGLAFPPLDRGPRIDRIDREIFMKSAQAVKITLDKSEPMLVPSCGSALPGHQIRVIGPTGHDLPECHEGRVQFTGPSSTNGYFRNPEATAALLDGEWRNAGDLGYMADGEVYITGREKDLIIRAGRNIFPAELEEAVGNIDGVQKGNVAVFGSPDPSSGTERLIVMAEARRRNDEAQQKIKSEVNTMAIDLIGTAPDHIELTPPRTVPKTSSGKIRRQAARLMFESGMVNKTSRNAVKWQIMRLGIAGIIPSSKRTLESVLAWTYAIYFYLLMTIISPLAWILTAITPKTSWAYAIVRSFLWVIWRASGINVSVSGLENIPSGQKVIFTSNHSSYIDGPVLVTVLPEKPSFVAKYELAGNFFSRIFLTRLGTIFVERFKKTTSKNENLSSPEQAQTKVYFPEGTFTRMTGLLPFQMGAFTDAVETKAQVVPIAIRGTRNILRDDTGFPRRGKVEVIILPAISAEQSNSTWQAAIDLRNRIRATILDHCGEPDLASEHINPLHFKNQAEND